MFTRREMLRVAAAGAVAASLSPLTQLRAAPAPKKKKRLLVFTRSAGFQHSVVEVNHHRPSLVDSVWTLLGTEHGFDVECTKDGRVFESGSLAKFDAFFFYTTGDLTAKESKDDTPPMSAEGKKAFLDAIAGGKGFLGSHCATDTFHSTGEKEREREQDLQQVDPYIAMIGGEFIRHGAQQEATMHVVDHHFPGLQDVSDFRLKEEWYALKNFQPNLHVLLVQETAGMTGEHYQRPNFPATWARMHGKGRVFYTSLGHREDVWTNPVFQNMLTGAVSWAFGNAEADVTPNLKHVAPEAMQLPPYSKEKK